MVPESVLLPYQQRWCADPAPVKVYEKSRRVGISWAEAADSALTAACATGMDTWYVGYSKDMAEEFIRAAGDWTQHFQLAASAIEETLIEDAQHDMLAYRITYTSGYRVTALSSRPTNLRGKQGRVIIDEAAFHPDLPGLLKSALALLMWGGRVSLISTHNGEDNPFHEVLQDCRAGKKPYRVHRTTLDEALADGLYRRICLVKGAAWTPEGEAAWRQDLVETYGLDADEELFCIPKTGGGAWLPRPIIDQCMVPGRPVLRLALDTAFATWTDAQRTAEMGAWCAEHLAPLLAGVPRTQRHFVGTDFGRTGDLSVFAVLTETQDLRYAVPFLVELRNVPFEQQKQICFALGDALPRFSGAAFDAGGNGAYLAEVAAQRYGPRIAQVKLTEQFYREHMPPFKAALEDVTLTVPKDADVLQDLRAIAMTKGIAKVPETKRYKGADGGERHGDAAMALVLGHYAAKAGLGEAAGAMTQTDTQTYHSPRQTRRRIW